MPNIKQQKKRVRSAARQRLENLRYRSTVKTLTRRLEAAVANGEGDRVDAEHRELVRWIDRAAAASQHGRAAQGAGGAHHRVRRLVAGATRQRLRAVR
jgi:small subunit ribosomal protein S20